MSNMSYFFNDTINFFQRECTGSAYYTLECLNKYFCPQISLPVIKAGFYLIVGGFIISIIADLFFRRWYKRFDIEIENETLRNFIGDLNDEKVRLEWRIAIKDIIIDVFLFYIMLVIYLNI